LPNIINISQCLSKLAEFGAFLLSHSVVLLPTTTLSPF